MEELIPLFGTWYIQIIGALIALDILLGIIAAIFRKEFALKKAALFMKGPVLAYIFGFVILEFVAKAFSQFGSWFLNVSFVLIALALIGSVLKNLGRLGFPIPKFLKIE